MVSAATENVTRSCGCVFCDIRLPIVLVDDKPHHEATNERRETVMVPCTYEKIKQIFGCG